MKEKCIQKACFANGCDGYCRLDEIRRVAPHLIREFQQSEYTCSKVKVLAKEISKISKGAGDCA